jgi:hypothetical protein
MQHRRSDVRAAVFRRQRSQGHLRAVTATVGAAGVITAGVVAAILPGSTHASASSHTTSTPAPSAPATASSAATSGAAGTPAARHRRHHRHHRHHASAAATTAPAAPVPTPAATTAPPQSVSGGS